MSSILRRADMNIYDLIPTREEHERLVTAFYQRSGYPRLRMMMEDIWAERTSPAFCVSCQYVEQHSMIGKIALTTCPCCRSETFVGANKLIYCYRPYHLF